VKRRKIYKDTEKEGLIQDEDGGEGISYMYVDDKRHKQASSSHQKKVKRQD
jgi:hypothetical protein